MVPLPPSLPVPSSRLAGLRLRGANGNEIILGLGSELKKRSRGFGQIVLGKATNLFSTCHVLCFFDFNSSSHHGPVKIRTWGGEELGSRALVWPWGAGLWPADTSLLSVVLSPLQGLVPFPGAMVAEGGGLGIITTVESHPSSLSLLPWPPALILPPPNPRKDKPKCLSI